MGVFVATIFPQTPLMPRDSSQSGPQSFAMIMGISKYKYIHPLNYADKDAELFRDYLRSPAGGRLKDDNIFLLLNSKAVNANFFVKGFQWLKEKKLQSGDKLFIYLAGHGDAIDEDQYFFLGYDCNPGGDKNNYLVGGAIQLFNLKKKIADETARGVEVIFVMDACRSNELPGGTQGQNFLNEAITQKRAGEIMMLAASAGEESLEDKSIGTGHGLFTWYLVDGLTGMADSKTNPDNKISFSEIRAYVDANVPLTAEQVFKRKQDPFFCCNENSDKIIGIVDTAYLGKWIKRYKSMHTGPGNSFGEYTDLHVPGNIADTSLQESYRLFNQAITDNKLTGKNSAEYFFSQMQKKSSGSAYTLDAASTLAAEFINDAQQKVNRYLDCADENSAAEKRENFAAAQRLEKAIAMAKDIDADFANSLVSRLYFLKSQGDLGPNGMNGNTDDAFRYAYAALAIDKDKAYICNKLAQLHLDNNRPDSAVYYAEKATRFAPNWKCALTLLAKARQQQPNNPVKEKTKTKLPKKSLIRFGGTIGGGISQPKFTATNTQTNDTLQFDGTKGGFRFELGIKANIPLGNTVSIRPALIYFNEQTSVDLFNKRTGSVSTITQKTSSVSLPIPFVFNFFNKPVSPYITGGPVFSLLLQNSNADFPVKSLDISGDLGIGVDIGSKKSPVVISPELRLTEGFSNINGDKTGSLSRLLTDIKRKSYTFSVYIRKK